LRPERYLPINVADWKSLLEGGFCAIRRTSSFVSNFAARRPGGGVPRLIYVKRLALQST